MFRFLVDYSDFAIRKEKFEMEGWKSNNEFCVRHGHSWILTTSDSFRQCDRSGCGAVEKMINSGVWVLVSEKRMKIKKRQNTDFVCLPLF